MSLKTLDEIRFYDYSIDRLRWTIQWQGETIVLSRKSFDLLLYLIDHRDHIVSKDELMEGLWPDQFVEESNLTQHVFLVRKALSRQGTKLRIIETVAGRGYRFTAPVLELDPVEPEPAKPEPAKPEPAPSQVILTATESITRITVEEDEEETSTISPPPIEPSNPRRWTRYAPVALIVIAALCASAWFVWQGWWNRSGGAPLQVVLAPLDGTTGDAVLDKSLVQALRMDLVQSPYVSVVSSSTVRATLTAMMHKPDDPITPAMAREICERTNSQGVITGNIARAGQHFLIVEEATNCVDEEVLGQAKYEAKSPEELPYAMGKLATTLRHNLGESHRSIARFNRTLFQ